MYMQMYIYIARIKTDILIRVCTVELLDSWLEMKRSFCSRLLFRIAHTQNENVILHASCSHLISHFHSVYVTK